jgi:hypothetical protein
VSNPARDGAAVAATQSRNQMSPGAKRSGSSYGRRSGYGAAMRVKARRQHCSASCLMDDRSRCRHACRVRLRPNHPATPRLERNLSLPSRPAGNAIPAGSSTQRIARASDSWG